MSRTPASFLEECVMKTAFECFQHAARCERLARGAFDEINRDILLRTAEHWKTLGKEAKVTESAQLTPDHHRKTG